MLKLADFMELYGSRIMYVISAVLSWCSLMGNRYEALVLIAGASLSLLAGSLQDLKERRENLRILAAMEEKRTRELVACLKDIHKQLSELD